MVITQKIYLLKKIDLPIMAYKVQNGFNKNEVQLISKLRKKVFLKNFSTI